MKKWQQMGQLTVVLALACVTAAWVTGCSRQLAVPGSGGAANSGQLPFDRVSDDSGISPTAGFSAEGIPAGTEVTIRLRLPLSSADARAGDSFQAVLDEPIVVAGKTVVPRGTPVSGSVIAAEASGRRHDAGYLRVTLASIALGGRSVLLQTSSIFAKGGSYDKHKAPTMRKADADGKGVAESREDSENGTEPAFNPGLGDVRFSTGRRLTFRLVQPLHLQG
jgi:hypothetical protein